jgi:hypothetical protein
MFLKILPEKNKIIRATEKEIVIDLAGPNESIVMTTHYHEDKPLIQKIRLFVTDYGRIKRGG